MKVLRPLEIHRIFALNFLPQYAGSMEQADVALVYYDPAVVTAKNMKELQPEVVRKAFGGNNITVFTDIQQLEMHLKKLEKKDSALVFMSSGNFSGLDTKALAKELMGL